MTPIVFLGSVHSLTGSASAGEPSGLLSEITLIDSDGVLSPVELKPSVVSLSIRGSAGGNYSTFTIPIDIDLLDLVSAIVPTGIIELRIYGLFDYNEKILLKIFHLNIETYRFELGAISKSLTFISRTTINIPTGVPVVLTRYVSKQKLSASPDQVWRYFVNVNDLRLFTIGATFTEGTIVGTISGIALTLSAKNSLSLEIIE